MPLNDNVSGITTLFPHLLKKTESRRDHEEGDELDSQEEASPDETKSREVSWTLRKKLAHKRSRGGR